MNIKKRNWAFVLYPESAPKDWKEQLQQTGLGVAISPLHDKDLDPSNTPKKAHYHIILCYSGPTSYNVVKRLTDSLYQPIPIALEQVRGYYRYFTHLDNPDKYQYDEKEIFHLNGFSMRDFIDLTNSEVIALKRDLQLIIRTNTILEYADLLDFLLDNDFNLHWEVASNNTFLFNTYITSFRNKLKLEFENSIISPLKNR